MDDTKLRVEQPERTIIEEARRYCISYDPSRNRVVFAKVNEEGSLQGQVFTYKMELPELQDFITHKLRPLIEARHRDEALNLH